MDKEDIFFGFEPSDIQCNVYSNIKSNSEVQETIVEENGQRTVISESKEEELNSDCNLLIPMSRQPKIGDWNYISNHNKKKCWGLNQTVKKNKTTAYDRNYILKGTKVQLNILNLCDIQDIIFVCKQNGIKKLVL